MVIDGIETFDQNKIANGFNKYFTEIRPRLATSIPASSRFLNSSRMSQKQYYRINALQDQELEEAFSIV